MKASLTLHKLGNLTKHGKIYLTWVTFPRLGNYLCHSRQNNAYVQNQILPKPKKFTLAALGLLGTFCMSAPGHLLTWSPPHLVTWSPPHLVTWSPPHLVVSSTGPRHQITSSPAHLIVCSPGHFIPWSPGHLTPGPVFPGPAALLADYPRVGPLPAGGRDHHVRHGLHRP